MALAGRATAEGTARFAARFDGGELRGAYGYDLGWTISSVGYGTAAGDAIDEVDEAYIETISEAVRCGCNVFDTAPSYRAQRSEVALGRAIGRLVASKTAARDELIIASKAGYIPYRRARPADPVQYVFDTFIQAGVAEPDDLAGGIHCMTPDFISQQVAWSLRNIDLRTVDIYFLQNPETQLAFVDRNTFRRRLQLAFARLEEEVAAGRLGCYGVASWEGFRRAPMADDYMSLEVMMRLVVDVAGVGHHFRVIQLPISLAATEALTFRNQPVRNSVVPFLQAAHDLGITVFASAGLGQGHIPERLDGAMKEFYPELEGQAQRALQYTRSLPGVTSALFGSTSLEHVRECLAVLHRRPDAARALKLGHYRGR